jgi:Cu2+-exporting ATPase
VTDRTEDEVLALAASLERQSEHPIAKAIVAAAEERGLAFVELDSFVSLPGKGVEARRGDRDIKVVSPGYLREAGIEPPAAAHDGGPMTRLRPGG